MHFPLIFQEVRPISKTRNQLSIYGAVVAGVVSYGHKVQLKNMRTRYVQYLHTTLDDICIGEKVLIAHRPDPTVALRVSNGVVIAVNATSIRVAWEGANPPPLNTFTEEQLCYLAFEQPEPVINVDML
jgi:hypothetical protein